MATNYAASGMGGRAGQRDEDLIARGVEER